MAVSGDSSTSRRTPRVVRLVETGWEQELEDGLAVCEGSWVFACPFIKASVVGRLLNQVSLTSLRVVTRFNLADFASGVSDVAALRTLVEAGGEVRGLKHLHSKVYVFGRRRAAITSANLTQRALHRNAELGCISEDPTFVASSSAYVSALFDNAGASVVLDQLDVWDDMVTRLLAQGARPMPLMDLPDFGADPPEAPVGPHDLSAVVSSATGWPAESLRAFVKFFGQGDDRASADESTLDSVAGAGCHWACTYPKGKRPRQVRDGDTVFMGRMTHSPDDTLIFGRAIGMEHVDERDDATPTDIAERPWKADWPHYVRVHHGEFIDGTLRNAVSLNELMNHLGPDSFGPTQENQAAGGGNTDPRRSLMQKAHMRLTTEAFAWLTERFEDGLASHGRISTAALEQLDWPKA